MTSRSRRKLEHALFDSSLGWAARLARSPLRSLVARLMAAAARAVRAYRGAESRPLSGEGLGREWQRLMPNRTLVPITHVVGDTAYGEIHVHCPLRGSGDVDAC